MCSVVFYIMKILIKPAANCVIKLYACHQHRRTEMCMQFSDIQYNYDIWSHIVHILKSNLIGKKIKIICIYKVHLFHSVNWNVNVCIKVILSNMVAPRVLFRAGPLYGYLLHGRSAIHSRYKTKIYGMLRSTFEIKNVLKSSSFHNLPLWIEI